MRILVSYRGIPQSPGWATGDMVVKAFRSLGHFTVPYAKYYQQDSWVEQRDESWTQENKFQEISRQDWDLILFLECNDGDRQYGELKNVRARKTACWFFDNSYYADMAMGIIGHFNFNHHFIANPLVVQHFNHKEFGNNHYLPYACDIELHGRKLNLKKNRKCALIGSVRKDRKQLVKALSKRGIELELIGDLYREDYINALASTQIVVNQNPAEGVGLLNMRWFEAPAAGAIILGESDDLKHNPVFQGWNLGHDSLDDIVNFINGQNETSLAIMAHELQSHVYANHTYQNRCQEILDTVFSHETGR